MGEIYNFPGPLDRCQYCLDYKPSSKGDCASPNPPHWVQTWRAGYVTCGFRPDLEKLRRKE